MSFENEIWTEKLCFSRAEKLAYFIEVEDYFITDLSLRLIQLTAMLDSVNFFVQQKFKLTLFCI